MLKFIGKRTAFVLNEINIPKCYTIIAPVESRVDSSQMGSGLLAQQGTQLRFEGRFSSAPTGTSTPVTRPTRGSYNNKPYRSLDMARAPAQARGETNQGQSFPLHRSN